MYANIGINNFEASIRKSTFGFIQRLAKSTNSPIMTIEKSWSVRIDIWNFWKKLCTLLQQYEFRLQMLIINIMYVNCDMLQHFFYLYPYFYIL